MAQWNVPLPVSGPNPTTTYNFPTTWGPEQAQDCRVPSCCAASSASLHSRLTSLGSGTLSRQAASGIGCLHLVGLGPEPRNRTDGSPAEGRGHPAALDLDRGAYRPPRLGQRFRSRASARGTDRQTGTKSGTERRTRRQPESRDRVGCHRILPAHNETHPIA